MSIAYLDPGNIESDLQSGAVAQFKVSMKLEIIKFPFGESQNVTQCCSLVRSYM